MQEKGFDSHDAYSLSKLASMLFTYELARRLKAAGSPVTANCLDPGTVSTKMLAAGWGSFGMRLQVNPRKEQSQYRGHCSCGKWVVV